MRCSSKHAYSLYINTIPSVKKFIFTATINLHEPYIASMERDSNKSSISAESIETDDAIE
jgi:hypothetical protein